MDACQGQSQSGKGRARFGSVTVGECSSDGYLSLLLLLYHFIRTEREVLVTGVIFPESIGSWEDTRQ
jgi:hypothetical protein